MGPRSTQLYFVVGTGEMDVRASDQLKRVAGDSDVELFNAHLKTP